MRENDEVLAMGAVCNVTGLTPATIYRYERAGLFPQRRRLGPRRIGWLRSDVAAWLASRPVIVPRRGR